MFCGFTTNQCNIHRLAGISNAANDIRNPGWLELSAGNVIGHEQTASAGDHNVVDHHANQVLTNCVVLV